LPQWPLIYDCTYFCILVCPEKFCYFRKKLWYVRKSFCMFVKIMICPEHFLSWPPPLFRCPFLSKSAPRNRAPPQLFYASYAPDHSNALWRVIRLCWSVGKP
jgi:hypothetical protein